MDVKGKTVVVTGAASGIGRALATRFAAEGAAGVGAGDLDAEGAQATVNNITSRGGTAHPNPSRPPGRAGGLAPGATRTHTLGPHELFGPEAGLRARRARDRP